MKPLFKRMMQIGIIVRNVDEAVKAYESLGVGPWEVTVMRNDIPPFEDMTFDGKPFQEKGPILKTAMMTCYGLELELIEPVADTVYKKWLDEYGPGLHHVAMDLDAGYEEVLLKVKEKTGRDPWVRGQGLNGLMDFSYLDLRNELGLIVECYKDLQPGKPALPYDMKGETAE